MILSVEAAKYQYSTEWELDDRYELVVGFVQRTWIARYSRILHEYTPWAMEAKTPWS